MRPEENLAVEVILKINSTNGWITFETNFVPTDWYAQKWLIEENVEVLMESELQTDVVLEFKITGEAYIVAAPNRVYYSNEFSLTFPTVVVGLLKRYLITVNVESEEMSEITFMETQITPAIVNSIYLVSFSLQCSSHPSSVQYPYVT